jgi:hypothetical protein
MLCLRKSICFHLWDRVGESYCCVYDIFLFCTHVQEDFEDTKGVIKIHKSQMYRQHKDYKEKDKRTNNDVQNTTQKTKDRAARITQNRWHITKQKQKKKNIHEHLGWPPRFWWDLWWSPFQYFVLCFVFLWFLLIFFLCFLCLHFVSCVLNTGSVSGLPFLDWPVGFRKRLIVSYVHPNGYD